MPLRFSRGAAIGALCAALLAAVALRSPSLFGAEWWLFDRYSKTLASSRPVDPRIVLVTVSESAVRNLAELYGRPPYSREVWALVTGELRRCGAAVIGFDLLFSEENPGAPEGDRAFAAALEKAPVVLGVQTEEIGNRASAGATPRLPLWNVHGTDDSPMHRVTPPLSILKPSGVGSIRFAARDEATAHHYALLDRVDGGHVPSLGLETARQFLRATRNARRRSDSIAFDSRQIPISSRGEMLIRWNGSKQREESLSYARVDLDKVVLAALLREEGSLDPKDAAAFEAQFRGKIVLIGYTAAGLMDLRANPLSPVAPGLELHANAIDNIINADFNRAAAPLVVLPLMIVIAALFGAGIDTTRSQLVAGIAAVIAIGVILGAGYAALAAGHAVPALTAAIAIALTWVVITVVKFMAEQRQTAMLRGTFGRYVSPQILEHILAHPEKVQLGGERRDLTILFSDIRGFTSISEANEPEDVVEMLNEYLTKMVDILLRHGGTLDKFIGDAVMGFWNAPADDPDHARKAVACAVEMVEETARLREQWQSVGKAAIRIGVGINTGEAIAGNIGSERVFGYTVIGDAVNLASRLEGKNKDYGTEIIVSESTLARMGDGFQAVYLDEVKVKGKENAVKIYEVKGTR